MDPLSALNLSDRRQRVLQWHRHYESQDWKDRSVAHARARTLARKRTHAHMPGL